MIRPLKKNIALIPGVGFDVVPTDCVAKNLAEALPDATHLALSFRALGGIFSWHAPNRYLSHGQ